MTLETNNSKPISGKIIDSIWSHFEPPFSPFPAGAIKIEAFQTRFRSKKMLEHQSKTFTLVCLAISQDIGWEKWNLWLWRFEVSPKRRVRACKIFSFWLLNVIQLSCALTNRVPRDLTVFSPSIECPPSPDTFTKKKRIFDYKSKNTDCIKKGFKQRWL